MERTFKCKFCPRVEDGWLELTRHVMGNHRKEYREIKTYLKEAKIEMERVKMVAGNDN